MTDKDLKCPYCHTWQNVEPADDRLHEVDIVHEMQCEECEQILVFNTQITFIYEASEANCLNGGEHTYKPTSTHPVICTRMICTQCETKREPTRKEWIEIFKNKKQ